MKKTILFVLLVFLTLCMFVACSSSPKDDYVGKVHLEGVNYTQKEKGSITLGLSEDLTGDFYFNLGNSEIGDEGFIVVLTLYTDSGCKNTSGYELRVVLDPSDEGINIGLYNEGYRLENPIWATDSRYQSSLVNLTRSGDFWTYTFSSSFDHEFTLKNPYPDVDPDGDYKGTITLTFEKEASYTFEYHEVEED